MVGRGIVSILPQIAELSPFVLDECACGCGGDFGAKGVFAERDGNRALFEGGGDLFRGEVAFRTDNAEGESPSVASPQLSAEISEPPASTPPSQPGGNQPAAEKNTTGSSLPASNRRQPSKLAAGTATGAGRLSIPEFGVGRQVVNRRLEGRGDRFEEGGVAWFSTRVLGGEAGEYIRHVWLHEGKTVQSIELKLGGPHWRTHSRKTLWSLGRWTVEARDPQDRVLARATFTCIPGGS